MAEAMPLAGLLRRARDRLEAGGIENAELDARLVVEHAAGVERLDAVRDPQRAVPGKAVQAVEAALSRRLAGEPVHRILGHREFRGLKLVLSPETLEPRPDTEAVVDLVLPFVRATAMRTGACRILDLGTGTGAIAIALLAEEPLAETVATDISAGALETAARNADLNGVAARFRPLASDWFGDVAGSFDLIVSNPPYVRRGEIARLGPEVACHDPRAALDGGADGLDAYRAIAGDAGWHLAEGGRVAVEIGRDQRFEVVALFAEAGLECEAYAKDLAGHDRALVFAAA